MTTLNLDEIQSFHSHDKPCVLCMHGEYMDLEKVFTRLCRHVSNKNLFDTIYTVYLEKSKALKRQQITFQEITRQELEYHFLYHYISHEHTVVQDIRRIKEMIQHVLNDASLNTKEKMSMFQRLSSYQMQLFSSLDSEAPQNNKNWV